MNNKKDHRLLANLFLLFIMVVTLFSLGNCRSVPAGYSKKADLEKEDSPHRTPASIVHLDGIELLASIKGEFFHKEERLRFRALLRISALGEMRLEIFNPLGKMVSITIFSEAGISLYIPSLKVLYRGIASPENMFKLFGFKLEPQKIVDILSGIEPFLALQGKGLFNTVRIQDGSSWKDVLTDKELWILAQEGGSLILKSQHDQEMSKIEVLSHYIPESLQDKCFLIAPKEEVIFIEDHSVKLKIQLREIRSYLLFADGNLQCGFKKNGIALHTEGVFTDQQYENMPGVDLINLDHLIADKPLFMGE